MHVARGRRGLRRLVRGIGPRQRDPIVSTPAFLASALGHVRTPVYRNAYSLMLSNGLTSALGLVYWTIAPEAYPAEVMGASSAAISMMLFLSGAAQLNLRPALLRLLPESGDRAVVARPSHLRPCHRPERSHRHPRVRWWRRRGCAVGRHRRRSPRRSACCCWSRARSAGRIFNLQDGVLTGLRRTGWVPVENGDLRPGQDRLSCSAASRSCRRWASSCPGSCRRSSSCGVVTVVLAPRWIPAYMAAQADRRPVLDRRT